MVKLMGVLVGLLALSCDAGRQPVKGKQTLIPDASGGERLLARVRMQEVHLDPNTVLKITSAVPVSGDGASFVALLSLYDDKLWQHFQHQSLYCATTDGAHRASFRAFGGETNAAYQNMAVLAFECDWPPSLQAQPCQAVVIQDEHHSALGTVEACNDVELNKETYELASCIAPIFHDAAHPEMSGLLKLPQWIEYNAMHGVQQFVVYTWPDSDGAINEAVEPYVRAGLVTKVAMGSGNTKQNYANAITSNDCLYRMKHRAKWLMPFIDSDEYLNFNPHHKHDNSFSTGISGLLEEHDKTSISSLFEDHDKKQTLIDANGFVSELAFRKPTAAVNSVSFMRFTFRYPSTLMDLQLSSVHREADLAPLCPKYITRPNLVHALFNHWPTSWEPDTTNVMFPKDHLVGHHYRTLDTTKTTVEDRSLEIDAAEVSGKLQSHFGRPWASYAAMLCQEVGCHKSSPPESGGSAMLQSRSREEALAATVPEFVRHISAVQRPEVIQPPSEISIRRL